MAYSVMVWLVDPGKHPQEEEEQILREEKGRAPGASSGVNTGPAIPRMVYGVYESEAEAEGALKEISNNLQQNVPLRIDAQSHRVFLIPADRVHYVACQEVTRPQDEQ